jgi:hypothetical protein
LTYVASWYFQEINIFNLNLTLNDTILITPYRPWSINEHNNELYVGTNNEMILVIVNKMIIQQFNRCNGKIALLSSIMFDGYRNIANVCNDKYLYLYNKNESYLNKSIPILDIHAHIGLDAKSRLVVVTHSRISLYN